MRVKWVPGDTWSLDLGGSIRGAIYNSAGVFQEALDSVSYNETGGTLSGNTLTYDAATHYGDAYCFGFPGAGGPTDNPFAYVPEP
jgi:hypothetical protein